jgi:hypothetical protein
MTAEIKNEILVRYFSLKNSAIASQKILENSSSKSLAIAVGTRVYNTNQMIANMEADYPWINQVNAIVRNLP